MYCPQTEESLLLEIIEGILQQIRKVLLQEVFVRGSNGGLFSGINGLLNLATLNEVEHAGQKHGLRFETYRF